MDGHGESRDRVDFRAVHGSKVGLQKFSYNAPYGNTIGLYRREYRS